MPRRYHERVRVIVACKRCHFAYDGVRYDNGKVNSCGLKKHIKNNEACFVSYRRDPNLEYCNNFFDLNSSIVRTNACLTVKKPKRRPLMFPSSNAGLTGCARSSVRQREAQDADDGDDDERTESLRKRERASPELSSGEDGTDSSGTGKRPRPVRDQDEDGKRPRPVRDEDYWAEYVREAEWKMVESWEAKRKEEERLYAERCRPPPIPKFIYLI